MSEKEITVVEPPDETVLRLIRERDQLATENAGLKDDLRLAGQGTKRVKEELQRSQHTNQVLRRQNDSLKQHLTHLLSLTGRWADMMTRSKTEIERNL